MVLVMAVLGAQNRSVAEVRFTVFRLRQQTGRRVFVGQFSSCQDVRDELSEASRKLGFDFLSTHWVVMDGSTVDAVTWLADHSVLHPFGLRCADAGRAFTR